MNRLPEDLTCHAVAGIVWVMCPVCKRGKLMKLNGETQAKALTLYCRRCRHESLVDIEPRGKDGHGFPRVKLVKTARNWAISGAVSGQNPAVEA